MQVVDSLLVQAGLVEVETRILAAVEMICLLQERSLKLSVATDDNLPTKAMQMVSINPR